MPNFRFLVARLASSVRSEIRLYKSVHRLVSPKQLYHVRTRGWTKTGLGGPTISAQTPSQPHIGVQKLFDKPSIRFGSSWELHPRHGQDETNTMLAFAAKKLECGDAVNHFVSELSPEAVDSLLKSLLVKARNEAYKAESDIMFSRLDANNDGVLSKEEFMRLASAAVEESALPVEDPTFRQVRISLWLSTTFS